MHKHTTTITALALATVATSSISGAQSLLPTQGVVIAATTDVVPDASGAPTTWTFFTGNGFDNPIVDDAGNVFFRGRIEGAPAVNTWDDRAYFYGSTRSNLKMMLRAADQAPGFGPGVLLRSTTGLSATITSTYKITPSGVPLWGALVWDQPGTNGVTSANDEGLFGGPYASQSLLVQQGAQLPPPAAVGTTFAQAFSSFNVTGYGYNGTHVYVLGTTTGGDTVTGATGNNQTGLWSGVPGALNQVARKNNPVSGLGGEVAVDTTVSFSSVQQMNASGNLLYDVILSTTAGAPPATQLTDRALMMYTQGVGSQVIVRESDVAPGTSGAQFLQIAGTASENWAPVVNPNAWTRSNKTAFASTLRGGDVVGTTNDQAIFTGGVGTLALAVRKGDAAPGTDGNFNVFNNVTVLDSGRICFSASLTGGTTTTATDTGIWAGLPGALQLVAREGMPMPGTGGSNCGPISTASGAAIHYNDTNRVVFVMALAGGAVTGTSCWTWSPVSGLKCIVMNGDQIEVQPTVFKTATGVTTNSFINNTDGAPIYFSHTGQLATSVSLSDSTRVIMRLYLPAESAGTPFCLGDGTGAACPCGNTGAAGHGCASSSFATGAKLTASGFAGASLATDTLVLTATNIPGPGLFFQSSGLAPTPINFGDGHLCAAVGIIRMGVVFSAGGIASYPGGTTPNPIHIAGLTSNGDVRHYQCWYRSLPSLCTVMDNFDTTQGLTITWGP
jgi:hypothetical protein